MAIRVFSARWIFPVSGPPLERGTVTVEGEQIASVDPHGVLTPDEDLGNVAIVPGLVNAHTHLDLSGARGVLPPTDAAHFTDWLRGVIAFRRSRSPEQTQADIRAGIAESLRAGVTLLGDIAAEGASWDALAGAPVRAVVYRELIGLTAEGAAASSERAAEWASTLPDTPTCAKGVSPHAPYSVRFSLFLGATGPTDRLAFHFAESPAEMELLRSRTGPFREFLESLGVWDETGIAPHPESYLTRSRSAGFPTFVHCNYLPLEWCRYIAGTHTIVYCPRTHAAFGHPPHPFQEFLSRGVRMCLGTDSLASNPDLDVLAEARFLHERVPEFPGYALLRMVTLSGAEALGWAEMAGSLEAGKSADFVAVPLPEREAGDPHELLFSPEPAAIPRRTLFRGDWQNSG